MKTVASRFAFAVNLICLSLQPILAAEDDRVVVTVNGVGVLEQQVVDEADNRIDMQKTRDAARGLIFEESARESVRDAMRDEVIHALIERRLIADQLKSQGLDVTDAEVQSRFAKKVQSAGQTLSEAVQQIEVQGRTLRCVQERIRWNEIGVEKLYYANDQDQQVLTEAAARKLYDEYPGEFDQPELRRVSHILVRTNLEDSPEKKTRAREHAQALLARVLAGEDFARVAAEHSEDIATKAVKGDRGWSSRGIILTPQDDPFGNVAFAMKKIGDVSDVVETRDGYHIIKLTGLKPAGRLPFEEVKQKMIDDFYYREVGNFWAEFGEQLMKKARIEYSAEELAARKTRQSRQEKFNREMEERIAAEKARQQAERVESISNE
jgi:peptidyl-prolyl cis-trans isomerase C